MGDLAMLRKPSTSVIGVIAIALLAVPTLRAADDMFEGKVLSVGDGTLMIMGKTNNDNKAFTVNAETKVMRNGKPGKLADVQIGDKAKISAASTGGKLIAKEIIAASPDGFRYARRMWR
jgi:hypothetical protein